MKKNPLVSILVANWNGANVLPDFISSLNKQSYKNWELIFVDNGSTDNSLELLDNLKNKKKLIIIENKKNLGFVGANNQGSKKAKGKYILLLNNDTKFDANLINDLLKRIERSEDIAVVQPKILMMDNLDYLDNAGSFPTKIGFFVHWGFGQKDGPEFEHETEIFSAKGACMLIRKSIIDNVGLFDDNFFSYFEETDFCWRVQLQNKKIIFYPEVKILHKVGFTIKRLDVLNINFHYYKNRINSLIKNLGTVNLFIILPLHLVTSLGIAILFLLFLKPNNSLMILKAVWWNIVNLKQTLIKRSEIQGKRKISDKQLFNKFMRNINFLKFAKDFLRVKKDIDERN